MSSILKQRVRCTKALSKLCSVEDVIPLFKDDMWLGWSGFTGVGGPKVIPKALVKHVKDNNLQGKLGFNLITGASTDVDVESDWADNLMIRRRTPHQVGSRIRNNINNGNTLFFDKHLSMVPQDMTYGFYTSHRPEGKRNSIDFALIEATAINPNGELVLGPSVGAAPELAQYAEKVIVEVNTDLPSFEGIHDINFVAAPPHREPFMIRHVSDRIGSPTLHVDPDKIAAVIESTEKDTVPDNSPADAVSNAIAGHIVDFFEQEVRAGRMPANLLPLQSGIGNVANAIVGGLAKSKFDQLEVWTEVFQDSFLDFLENGKLSFASSTSVRLTQKGFVRFFKDFENFSKKILLRSQQMANNPELIRRLGCIAMNTPIEVDIYGHANSTCVNGSRMMNGLGGSGDFLRNAKLSIMHTPSVRPTKTDPTGLSTIVPMCSHIDQTEHDLDIIVTEQGLADLRGLAPRERSREIIKKCSHPDFRDQLMDYVDFAEKYCGARRWLHEPQVLSHAHKMHVNVIENGTMKLKSW